MADYFAGDVHLRLDFPERAARLAAWVATLRPDDALTLVGDLCDFYFASRQLRDERALDDCAALRALADFRDRGGALAVLPGNHDFWLLDFYERVLGARRLVEPYCTTSHGLRLRVVHGHLLGARSAWKGWMESRAFLRGFRAVPGAVARRLDLALEARNLRTRDAVDVRHLALYHKYADAHADDADIVVFGHIHGPLDDAARSPRVVVVGGWHARASYLAVDDRGARLVIERDRNA